MEAARSQAATVGARRIWVLAGDKPGDNAQSLSLAAALGWPTEVKQLRYGSRGPSPFPPFGEVRFPLDVAASSPLEPPWPELVIGCGRRSVGVACEIRRRAGAGTRLVQLGRPRADLALFDLVVTTPQYRLPERANVLHLALPMHRFDRDAATRAAAEWEPAFAALPLPRIALLVGGTAKPFVFDAAAARRLAAQVNALVRGETGSLLVSPSRRTPAAAAQVLSRAIEVPAYVHHWSAEASANPYLAYLALADAFVVTGDSASMLTEACSTGRRVWIAELPERRSWRSSAKNLVRRSLLALAESPRAATLPLTRRLAELPVKGRVRYPRDLSRLHDALIRDGRALPLGRTFTAPIPAPVDETEIAAARVRRLFG